MKNGTVSLLFGLALAVSLSYGTLSHAQKSTQSLDLSKVDEVRPLLSDWVVERDLAKMFERVSELNEKIDQASRASSHGEFKDSLSRFVSYIVANNDESYFIMEAILGLVINDLADEEFSLKAVNMVIAGARFSGQGAGTENPALQVLFEMINYSNFSSVKAAALDGIELHFLGPQTTFPFDGVHADMFQVRYNILRGLFKQEKDPFIKDRIRGVLVKINPDFSVENAVRASTSPFVIFKAACRRLLSHISN
ncbi:MAG: hypothetical protein IPK68_10930 [Bdellovibrionales bacterium]|nr:hypothetical protein [Bdellovibrionales bacterium]